MHVCVLLGTWVHYSWWLPVLNAVPMAVLTAVAIPFPPLLLPLATCQLHQVLVIWTNGKILIMQLPTVQVSLPAVTNWQDFGTLLQQGYLQPCCAELHCFARCKAISVIYTTTTITTYVCVLGTMPLGSLTDNIWENSENFQSRWDNSFNAAWDDKKVQVSEIYIHLAIQRKCLARYAQQRWSHHHLGHNDVFRECLLQQVNISCSKFYHLSFMLLSSRLLLQGTMLSRHQSAHPYMHGLHSFAKTSDSELVSSASHIPSCAQ